MRGGTWIPLLATVPPSVIVDFVEFELFRAQYRRNEPSSSYDLCRHGKYPTFAKYPTFDKYFSIWLKNLEKKSLHQKLLRATKKRYKHVTTLAACWPSWRPQGWVAILAQNPESWSSSLLSSGLKIEIQQPLERGTKKCHNPKNSKNIGICPNDHKW